MQRNPVFRLTSNSSSETYPSASTAPVSPGSLKEPAISRWLRGTSRKKVKNEAALAGLEEAEGLPLWQCPRLRRLRLLLSNLMDMNLRAGCLRVNSWPPPRKKESSFRGSRSGASFDNTNRLYVGNLSWGVDDLALENLFSEQGKVTEAKVIYDRDSGRSKGFGFVTYSSANKVNRAIESLDGVDLNGRPI